MGTLKQFFTVRIQNSREKTRRATACAKIQSKTQLIGGLSSVNASNQVGIFKMSFQQVRLHTDRERESNIQRQFCAKNTVTLQRCQLDLSDSRLLKPHIASRLTLDFQTESEIVSLISSCTLSGGTYLGSVWTGGTITAYQKNCFSALASWTCEYCFKTDMKR